MDLYKKMKPFTPKTKTVNKDRLYFVDNNIFIKVDTLVERGLNEFEILNKLRGLDCIPKPIESEIKDSTHILKMTFIRGETLENCIQFLSKNEKFIIIKDLVNIINFLLINNVVHNDINESNIIFDLELKKTYLIDFETGTIENNINDLGSFRGLNYIINYLNI